MKAYEIVSEVLKLLSKEAHIGQTTLELDKLAEDYIVSKGGIAYNKGYHPEWAKSPYPYATCIGVNTCIAHGFPTNYKLVDGDLVTFDVSVKKDGLCGDAATTIGIGLVSDKDKKLLKVAKDCLNAGLAVVKSECLIRDVSFAMQSEALKQGYVINRNFTSHTIGEAMHMAPLIPHYFEDRNNEILKERSMICLEPMVTKKDKWGVPLNDWVWVTRDNNKSAVFEEMVKVTKDGYELLTNHL